MRGGWGIALQENPPALPSTNISSSRLLLLGTVHGDPAGYERAWKLLQRWQPDLVTVEVSRFSLRYRQRQEPRWQRLLRQGLEELPVGAAEHLAIRRLMAQVALPFEVRVARDYSRRHGAPWRPLDLGGLARRHLPRYARELLSPVNLKALLATEDEPLEDYVAREYRRARLACVHPLWRPLAADSESQHFLVRERHLVRRLRHCLASYGRVAHLGGWEHLVPWREVAGLWQKLADHEPLRLFLDEADDGN
ncbi:MAG: hypothetical protein NTY36_07590 [Deltaproteobacteria bacterium]|nr:hypothetical protein [Deltaproteobacteria bacterium]